MKCIVTGAAGFIGSHLVDLLLSEGHRVVGLDNLQVGRLDNLAQHKDNEAFEFVLAGVEDYEKIEPHFAESDWVFHLAAMADIVPSIENPAVYHQSNVDGTVCVLEAAKKHQVKRFIYAASSSCYGLPDNFPTSEKDDIRPMYPYALTKFIGEQYVLHWGKVYGLPVVSLRMFNVYGPRARTSGTYGAVFGVFLAQKLANRPFTVVGDGTQTRDFTYVTDIVRAYLLAAESNIECEVMNLGSGGTYSIKRLVELIGGKIEYIPKRPGEPDCTFADVSKVKDLLGWEANVSFEEGVQRMLNHIDYWKDAPVWSSDQIQDATKSWFQYLGKTDDER